MPEVLAVPTISVQPQPSPVANNTNYILDAQDPSSLLESVKLFLKGQQMSQNPQTRLWELVAFGKPYLNDQGVAALCGIIQTKVNKIVLNGNYKDPAVINRIMIDFGETLSDFMTLHYSEWAMDLGSSDVVYWTIIDLVDSVYSQTYDPTPDGVGGWRKFGMTTYNFQELRDTSPIKPQSFNPLSSLPFGGTKQGR